MADDGPDGGVARHLLRSEAEVALPDLCDVEVASVLRRRGLAGDLSGPRLAAAVDDLLALPYARYPSHGLLRRAMDLWANVTPYDGVYVALAEVLDAVLVTGDRRLAGAPGLPCDIRVLSGG